MICRWCMGDSEWSPEIFIPRTFKGDWELEYITWNRGRRVRESVSRNSRGRQIRGHQACFQYEFARHARVPKRSRVAQSITPSPPCSSRRLLRWPRVAGTHYLLVTYMLVAHATNKPHTIYCILNILVGCSSFTNVRGFTHANVRMHGRGDCKLLAKCERNRNVVLRLLQAL